MSEAKNVDEKILEESRDIAQSCKNICRIANEFEAEFGSEAWEKLYNFEKKGETNCCDFVYHRS